jgi:serine/threonine protein kinase
MKTTRTILFALLLCAVTAPKAQFIKEIAAGIGTNGLSASVNHSLGKKWFLGESFSVMSWKPSTYGSFINREGLAIMHLKYSQAGVFLRWYPYGKETIYGYQKTGLYLTGGFFYKFNDDWLTTSAFYAKRRLKNTDTDSVYYQTGEIKLIDFGESKDYFKEADDGGVGTMATIRGTPQYLSPILWKAHVEDGGNSRHVTHNIFKSDVFSSGLIFF